MIESKRKRTRKNKHPESEICKALWTWFFYTYRDERPFYLRIEIGGQRTAIQQGILKAEGAKAGTNDIFIAIPINGFHGFWLEVKTDKGRATQEQKDFQSKMENKGYYCAFGYGLDECKQKITDYMDGKIERVIGNKAMKVKN